MTSKRMLESPLAGAHKTRAQALDIPKPTHGARLCKRLTHDLAHRGTVEF